KLTWRRKTHRIRTPGPDGYYIQRHGWVSGMWGIRHVRKGIFISTDLGNEKGPGYVLTHIPSGFAVGGVWPLRSICEEVAARLNDWSSIKKTKTEKGIVVLNNRIRRRGREVIAETLLKHGILVRKNEHDDEDYF
ncbi:MAG TPA: hypothetical protein VKI62_02645, partial [Bacteroidota bacterium]|nr:hypothetical protein [Bacteroidota bacterium]